LLNGIVPVFAAPYAYTINISQGAGYWFKAAILL
jgi:hypothetical protein